ncbi:MAG: T9SS type A sorting domain-containing protein [Bacteroidetes bacterium]|nr:T9SS type A sorting domain-containing protein [Bacteroidota bacterium]
MKRNYTFFTLLFILAINVCNAQSVSVNNGWLYINGNKFFVKGIGYETHTRPGQVPWVYSFNPDLIRFDLQRIKNAGFNTIRTWGALTEEELKLVDESGLKILFGIWIDPAGKFGDASFRASAINQVNSVLNYSSKYNCVIGYLIMNEPQVENIYNAGAQNLLSLWQSVIDLIHQKHPHVPVSFSNTIVGDYINMDYFDFAGYNAYIYGPSTITGSQGYGGFLKYLKNNRASRNPLIITEFGLSVSPPIISTSDYTYGGNTIEKQMNGDLYMYRSLIDAGAQGGCVFQYHDGWWKGDHPLTHDPNPEEWFGLIEFANQNDIYGTPRPVWTAFEKYNKAIITDPKNEEIYNGAVPIEIFTTDDVVSFSVSMNGSVLENQNVSNNYYSGSLQLNSSNDIQDAKLVFNFFNQAGDTLKSETISILRTKNQIQLPVISMQIAPLNLNLGGNNYIVVQMTSNPAFTIDENKITMSCHPHIGWDGGTSKSQTLSFSGGTYYVQDYFKIPANTKVATFGAGVTIRYGDFTKRIFAQKILTNGSWASSLQAQDVVTDVAEDENKINEQVPEFSLDQNYPNPFNPETVISYSLPNAGYVTLKVYDVLGKEIATLVDEYQQAGVHNSKFLASRDASRSGSIMNYKLSSGVYFYRISEDGFSIVKKMVLMK